MAKTKRWTDMVTIKRLISFQMVFERLGIADQFKRSGDGWSGVCPLHEGGPLRNPNQFKVSRPKDSDWEVFHCFGDCAQSGRGGGSVIDFVMRLQELDSRHASLWFVREFADLLESGGTEKQSKVTHNERGHKDDRSGATVADRPSQAKQEVVPLKWELKLDADCEYLLDQRQFSPETIQRFGLGLCSRGFLKGYVGIPVYRTLEELPIGYIGRFPADKEEWTEEEPRYKCPPQFPRNLIVYNLPLALRDSRSDQPLVVVEGALSGVAHLWDKASMSNVVATLGASLSDRQAAILIETRRPILLCFDGNAREAMRLAAAKLIAGCFVRVVTLDPDRSPDDLSGDEIRELLAFAL